MPESFAGCEPMQSGVTVSLAVINEILWGDNKIQDVPLCVCGCVGECMYVCMYVSVCECLCVFACA